MENKIHTQIYTVNCQFFALNLKKFTPARKIYIDGVGRVGDNYLVCLRQLRKIWLFRIPSFCAESSSKERFTFQQLASSEALNWHVKGKTSDFFFAHSIVITVFTFTNFAQIWFDFWSFRKKTSSKALNWHVRGEKRSISSACLLRHDVIRLANENFRPFPTKLSNMLKNLNFIFKKCSFYC